MNRMLASLAAGISVSALMLPSPVLADFFIKKTKPKAAAPQPPAQPQRPVRRTRPAEVRNTPSAPSIPTTGIDPALMQQTIVEAKYTANLTRNSAEKTAVLQVTNGKSGWSVNFKNCVADNRCGTMEFYTLWRVSNDANVCTVWGNDVMRDPGRRLGKPYCYTVPDLSRQFHLKLSTDQAPYAGMDRLSPEEAKERMRGMIGVWSSALTQLPQAWEIASTKCPRTTDTCGGPPPKGASRSH
jgi:hypothetical protein